MRDLINQTDANEFLGLFHAKEDFADALIAQPNLRNYSSMLSIPRLDALFMFHTRNILDQIAINSNVAGEKGVDIEIFMDEVYLETSKAFDDENEDALAIFDEDDLSNMIIGVDSSSFEKAFSAEYIPPEFILGSPSNRVYCVPKGIIDRIEGASWLTIDFIEILEKASFIRKIKGSNRNPDEQYFEIPEKYYRLKYQAFDVLIDLELRYAYLCFYAVVAELIWLYFYDVENNSTALHKNIVHQIDKAMKAIDEVLPYIGKPIHKGKAVTVNAELQEHLLDWKRNYVAARMLYATPNKKVKLENENRNLLMLRLIFALSDGHLRQDLRRVIATIVMDILNLA